MAGFPGMPGGSSGFEARTQRGIDVSSRTARFAARHPQRRDGEIGAHAAVELEHLRDVHLVDVIGAEDEYLDGPNVAQQVEVLPDRVGGAAEPGGADVLRGGTTSTNSSTTVGESDHECETCSTSEVARYCVSTRMRRKPLFTRFESTKSISR
jgi:hypothetical protein